MWWSRIVFAEEIRRFGLSEREVREVLNKVVAGDSEWDIEDIKNRRDGFSVEVHLEFKPMGQCYGSVKPIEERAKDLFKLMETELERYATLKPYLATYFRCNGNGRSEVKEIMSRLGIIRYFLIFLEGWVMDRVEIIIDNGAIDENAKKKYEIYAKETGIECEEGLLFDDLVLDDAYVDENEKTVCFFFTRRDAKVCEDVEVFIQLSIEQFLEFLADNKGRLLKVLAELEKNANNVRDVLKNID